MTQSSSAVDSFEKGASAASAAVLPVRLHLASRVVERLRAKPVDVAVNRRRDAETSYSVDIRRNCVRRLVEVERQIVDDVTRLRHR